MPPKAKKGVDDTPVIVPRPTSANDRDIFASVKQLQNLANTEVKWKNRVSSAKHLSQVSRLKEAKLNRLIEVCDEGIASLQSQLQDFFASLSDIGYCNASVNVSSAGLVTRAGAISVPVAAAAPSGGKGAAGGKGAPAAPPPEETISLDAQARRKDQQEQMVQFIRLVYQQPRLSRERPPTRPQNPTEMQREFDLVGKLGSPNSQVEAAVGGAAAKPGKAPPALRPPKST